MNYDSLLIEQTMTNLRERLSLMGSRAAIAACFLNGVWLACVIYLAGIGDTAAQVRAHPGIFRLSIGSCILLTLLEVPILLSLVATGLRRNPIISLLGGLFYALYIPLNLAAYFLFGRLAPLVNSTMIQVDPIGAALAARQIEIGGPFALTGMLPILGYGVLGIGWCLLASVLWNKTHLWSVTAVFLFVSGLFSIVGAVGGFTASSLLEKGSLLGGVVSLPALALVAAALLRERTP